RTFSIRTSVALLAGVVASVTCWTYACDAADTANFRRRLSTAGSPTIGPTRRLCRAGLAASLCPPRGLTDGVVICMRRPAPALWLPQPNDLGPRPPLLVIIPDAWPVRVATGDVTAGSFAGCTLVVHWLYTGCTPVAWSIVPTGTSTNVAWMCYASCEPDCLLQ